MDEGYLLSESAVKRTFAAVRRLEGSAYATPETRTTTFDQGRYESFYNASGETVPSYGVIQFTTGFTASEAGPIQHATKPSTTFTREYGVNSGVPVEAGECGLCVTHGRTRILYGSSEAGVGPGVSLGPKPQQFGLAVNWPETTIVRGVQSSTAFWVWGSIRQIDSVLFKSTAAISANTTATVTIWTGAHGSEVESSPRISLGMRNRGASVSFTTGIFGKITWINGQPMGEPLDCAP